MQPITAETPRRDFTVQGVTLKGAQPYKEGDILDAVEAAVMNQVFLENVRNNLAKKVDACFDDEGNLKVDESGNLWTLERIQNELLEPYQAEYKWYERGTRRAMDPEEREARRLVADAVKQALRSAGKKQPENLDALIEVYYQKHKDTWHAQAAKILAQAKKGAPVIDLNEPIDQAA